MSRPNLCACFCVVLMLLLVAWAYWPGLNGPQVLDDFENLAPLSAIDLNRDFAPDIMAGNSSGPLGRPLSMASFTLEKLYIDEGLYGQKLVGLILHLINGFLVYLLSQRLFSFAGVRSGVPALLVAASWLSAPLLLSATLYVVQRMTILAGLFTLLALLGYCSARERLIAGRPFWPGAVLALLATVCATLSKESGLLALPLMTILEVFFYRFSAPLDKQRRQLAFFHSLLVLVPLFVLALISLLKPELLYGGYQSRDFGLLERVLTECRVLFDYVFQLVWPDVHRLGVYHDDVEISRSLMQPHETLIAVLCWTLIVLLLIVSAVRGVLLLPAFGIAFFLGAHSMESTVFPLELYFEHRNYIPAFGIFFTLIALCWQVSTRLQAAKPWLLLVCLVMISRNWLALSSQAVVWSDLKILHMEAANYHPGSVRAQLELAQVYAREGYIDEALTLVDEVQVYAGSKLTGTAVLKSIYYCMAGKSIPPELLDYEYLSDELLVDLRFNAHIYYLVRMILSKQCADTDALLLADQLGKQLLHNDQVRGTPKLFAAMMVLENDLARYDRSLEYAQVMLARNPDDIMALQFKLYLATLLERTDDRIEALGRLEYLRDAGRLNLQESYNLDLFVDESG